jgi:hypothetical protein
VNIIYNSSHDFVAYYYIATREYFEKRLVCSTVQNRGPYNKYGRTNALCNYLNRRGTRFRRRRKKKKSVGKKGRGIRRKKKALEREQCKKM